MERVQWPSEPAGSVPQRSGVRKENPVKRVVAMIGFLLDASTRRKGGRRVWSGMVAVLALVGVGLIAYPFGTQLWASRIQNNKAKEFASQELRQAYERDTVEVGEGEALTRLRIPKLKVDIIVVEGATGNALRAGAGHYPQSALPGDVGNVAIFGHRTGFGQPFRNVHLLKPGDDVILETPLGRYVYKVSRPFDDHGNPWVTHPLDWTVTAPTPTPTLTLITCDPPHTSKMRLIVRADLADSREIS